MAQPSTPPSSVAVLPPARCSRLTKAKALNFTICSLCPFIFFFFSYLFFLTFVNTQLPLHLACDDCAVVAAAAAAVAACLSFYLSFLAVALIVHTHARLQSLTSFCFLVCPSLIAHKQRSRHGTQADRHCQTRNTHALTHWERETTTGREIESERERAAKRDTIDHLMCKWPTVRAPRNALAFYFIWFCDFGF